MRGSRCSATAAALLGSLILGVPVRPARAQFLPYLGKNKVAWDVFDWRLYRSPHFDVHYDAAMEPGLPRLVGLAERSYRRLAERLDHEVEFRIPLIAYRTHSEFEQTNILHQWVDESIAAFAEPALNRVVLPVDSPDEELERLLAHELTHIFEFSMVYRGLNVPLLERRPPQWAFEGFADYLSEDTGAYERMLLRDAVLHDRLPPMSRLEFAALPTPVLGYKLGQAAFEAIEARWGIAGVRRLWWGYRREALGDKKSAYEIAFQVDAEEFDRIVERYIRETYAVDRSRELPWAYEKRLEPGRPLGQVVAVAPAPSGELLAVLAFNRTTGELDLALVSARDGSLVQLLSAGTTTRWLYLSLDGRPGEGRSIAWDPKGERLAVFARTGKRRALLVWDAASGHVLRRQELAVEQAGGVSFSPDGRRIAFAGLDREARKLFLLDLATGEVETLDPGLPEARTPAWAPDGGSLAFVGRAGGFDRLAEVDLASRRSRLVGPGGANELGPWFDPGGDLYYSSDRGGSSNLWRIPARGSAAERLSDSACGTFSPVRLAGPEPALVFLAYFDGRFELYREPLGEPRERLPLEGLGEPLAPRRLFPALDPLGAGTRPSRRLRLTDLSQVEAGVTSDGTFFAETSVRFEDMVGERELAISARSVRDLRSLHGVFRLWRGRWQWGFEAYDIATRFLLAPDLEPAAFRDDRAVEVGKVRLTGGGVGARYPVSLFTRYELGASVERRGQGLRDLVIDSELFRDGTELRLHGAFVRETTRFRSFGPVSGSSLSLAVSHAPPLGGWLSFTSGELDARRYLQLGPRSLVATRFVGFLSGGPAPQILAFGGTSEFRGAGYNSFAGTRGFFGNLELRFPLVDRLQTPLLALTGIRGTLFLDIGAAWTAERGLDFASRDGGFHLVDGRAALGASLGITLLGLPLHLDWAWPTDLRDLEPSRFGAWVGYDF